MKSSAQFQTSEKPLMKTLIVDDEPVARKVMRHLLKAHPEISVIGEADSVSRAISLANEHKPDLVFLDIEMPVNDGFTFISRQTCDPHIVFVTAHGDYAVRAFDVDAADFLLKPVDPERLALTISRLRKREKNRLEAADTIFLKDCGQMHAVPHSSIAAIISDSNFTRVYRTNDPSLFIRKAISEWVKDLPAMPFVRLDRSLIINTQNIHELKIINRDKSLLYLKGIHDPLVLRRIALARFRKLTEKTLSP